VLLSFGIMFLGQRSTQTEYFDLPGRPTEEIIIAFRELGRVNGFFRFSHPFEAFLPGWLGHKRCERLDILDVGAGTGRSVKNCPPGPPSAAGNGASPTWITTRWH